MTNKERMHNALAGRPVDRYPVTSVYNHLYQRDHFAELSGEPAWRLHEWSCMPPDEHIALYKRIQADQPDLIDYLSKRILEQLIEKIRALCAVGGDAVFIDDAAATADVISLAHYERFSLPYVTEMVHEIHRHGQKVILIYFGAVADRLEQIASTGADALQMEASMKGYVNDLAVTAAAIGERMTLFGNLNPFSDLQEASDAALADRMADQAAAGRRARGFVVSTGSPITPGTPASRVRRYIELGQAAQTG